MTGVLVQILKPPDQQLKAQNQGHGSLFHLSKSKMVPLFLVLQYFAQLVKK